MAATSHDWAPDKTQTRAPGPYIFVVEKYPQVPLKKQCARSGAGPGKCENKLIAREAQTKH